MLRPSACAMLAAFWTATPALAQPAETTTRTGAGTIGLLLLIAAIAIAAAFDARRRNADSRRAQDTAEARLTALLEAQDAGLVGLDRDARILFANTEARDLLSLTALPAPWPEDRILSDRAPDSRATLSLSTLTGGELSETRAWLDPGTGTPRVQILVSATPVTGSSGLAALVRLRRMTESDRHHQQNERAARLEALGQLTGGVAHDFNNILATIEKSVELALPDTAEEAEPYLDTALVSVRRGAELTSRLLGFARQLPDTDTTVEVGQLFTDFATLAAPAVGRKISLIFTPPEDPLTIRCDVAQLENVLLNLVLNSRDAIRDSGVGTAITIAARPRPDTALIDITVTDDGPGMPAATLSRATDPFFTTKQDTTGTGLGLSMAHGFAEQSGGYLDITSETGFGTTVTLSLPRGSAAARETDIPRGKGETLLLVDDEPPLLAITARAVEQLGYVVLTAGSAEEALRLHGEGAAFDLLLTDVVMPGSLRGQDLVRQLRAAGFGGPVIYMSGYGAPPGEDTGPDGDPVLKKPYALPDLARLLQDALNRRDSPAQNS
ncbi:ATP-binding protein [Primorskyibacter flagellatus]|nr:ATP-binding protein [Primorskyibacter flagellatus]